MDIVKMTKDDLMENIDLKPFTRIIWHGQAEKDEWGHLITNISNMHHRSEYEMVKRGYRKCGTLHITPQMYDTTVEQLMKDEMQWLPIQRTKSYDGFSHTHFPTDRNDMDSSVYGVIAKELKDAEKFREASGYMNTNGVNHSQIGELLGFPECCRTFFSEDWVEGFFDPMWQGAVNSDTAKMIGERAVRVEAPFVNIPLIRYVGLRFISHLPHAFTCEASAEFGKIWYEVGRDIDRQSAEKLKEILTTPFTWSVLHGIATIETPYFTIVTNSIPTKEKWTIEMHGVDI